ncbi:hypothetical protein RHSIM_Rhsim07G0131600 [Rhododendron simsii]|uniref:Uncharacterized protein n=1 Tax=Rhododendron simsii TaxID=118357 RepID=A0A834GLZ3_RHOSS|nr:hypothetical protein RHSIM_Rhsim07G0131600 [Rhododendron simsii]
MVGTLAGNRTKASYWILSVEKKYISLLLNSPWDVCFDLVNEVVYIAMAGQHQIWEHNTLDGVTRAFSGDGGSRLLAGGNPFFAKNLFKFGDHDGAGYDVLLQHPLGVLCGKDGQIYIADSYNHKIKKLDPASKRVSTVAGIGKAGFKDGMAHVTQADSVSLGNGFWVENPDATWTDGEIVEVNGEEIRVLCYFCAAEAHGSWFSPISVQWVTTQGKMFWWEYYDDDLKADCSNSTARSAHDVVTSLVYMPCADQLEHKKSNLLQPLKGL